MVSGRIQQGYDIANRLSPRPHTARPDLQNERARGAATQRTARPPSSSSHVRFRRSSAGDVHTTHHHNGRHAGSTDAGADTLREVAVVSPIRAEDAARALGDMSGWASEAETEAETEYAPPPYCVADPAAAAAMVRSRLRAKRALRRASAANGRPQPSGTFKVMLNMRAEGPAGGGVVRTIGGQMKASNLQTHAPMNVPLEGGAATTPADRSDAVLAKVQMEARQEMSMALQRAQRERTTEHEDAPSLSLAARTPHRTIYPKHLWPLIVAAPDHEDTGDGEGGEDQSADAQWYSSNSCGEMPLDDTFTQSPPRRLDYLLTTRIQDMEGPSPESNTLFAPPATPEPGANASGSRASSARAERTAGGDDPSARAERTAGGDNPSARAERTAGGDDPSTCRPREMQAQQRASITRLPAAAKKIDYVAMNAKRPGGPCLADTKPSIIGQMFSAMDEIQEKMRKQELAETLYQLDIDKKGLNASEVAKVLYKGKKPELAEGVLSQLGRQNLRDLRAEMKHGGHRRPSEALAALGWED